MNDDITQLPVHSFLGDIYAKIRADGLLLLQAEPGAGKTTLVPWHMIKNGCGKIIMTQPRRVAARSSAERIAELLGERLGGSVGVRTRHDSVAGSRLEVVTEAVFVRMIQSDPALDGVDAVIFDEFHERSLSADLGLALAWNSRSIFRPDLKIVIMSATISIDEIESAYGFFPSLKIPGRAFPVETFYCPPSAREKLEDSMARLVKRALENKSAGGGDILVFLPGMKEINRTRDALGSLSAEIEIDIMHGSMKPEEQRRVVRGGGAIRRIILSTNVCETSVTIPSVRVVVDSGLVRKVRFSPGTGMDHRMTTNASGASIEQRKGRAGRVASGVCYRNFSASEPREKFDLAQILTSDLSPLLLECALWGCRVNDLLWVSVPGEASVKRAQDLLSALGFIDDDCRISEDGKKCAALGVHPRLGAMIMSVQNRFDFSTACLLSAILELGAFPAGKSECDITVHADAVLRNPQHNGEIIREARRIASCASSDFNLEDCRIPGCAAILLKGFPDNAARRMKSADAKNSVWLLGCGRRALLSAGVFSEDEYLVACELDGGEANSRILLAAPLEASYVNSGRAGVVCERDVYSWSGWSLKRLRASLLGRLIIKEIPVSGIDEAAGAKEIERRVLREGLDCLPWPQSAGEILLRARWGSLHLSGFPDMSDECMRKSVLRWLVPFADFNSREVISDQAVLDALRAYIGWGNLETLSREVPESFTLPSGTSRKIDYSVNPPVIAARLQEFFGCADTPVICGEKVMLHLLSPANRPVQITRDLAGFWQRSYADVKKELKGRYPRHYWPDNPLEAQPTARAKPRVTR